MMPMGFGAAVAPGFEGAGQPGNPHVARRRTVDRERPMHAALADQSSLELAAQLIDRELTPATAALRRELEQRFQQIIAGMDESDREVILMRHFEQLSNQDVAAALGL